MPHADTKTQPTISGVHLRVNDGPLVPSSVSLLHASNPSEPLSTLRERYASDGYLFLKGLIPRDDVLAARAAYFSSLAPSGVLKPGTLPVDGIFDADGASAADFPGIGAGSVKNARPGTSDTSVLFTDMALRAHTEAWYAGSDDGTARGFARHAALGDFVALFSGWGEHTLAIRRSLLRNNTPGNRAIGVHYDQSFMRYGEPTSITAWVPMGDIRLEGGGLIYLEGEGRLLTLTLQGEALGAMIEEEFAAKARAAGMSNEETRNAFNANMMSSGFLCDGPAEFGRQHGKKWLVAAYEAGDVVLHSPHMIHASTINDDPDNRIRLGTDLRFVNSARPWDTRWSNHYTFDDGFSLFATKLE
ncbi:phytanoyl-CoA hydroxylase [Purpureocillium lavendulum]|uniref:Phytanoyl-CoA hydroxylase n=1 Tax=Purpureocillium lavendulum TaxID=1247861 RepID=A0AB34FUF5_9HYPO|nr:phytanoyl-CoA hydroxylase [Purpureocillium lavendulum]